MFCTNCGNKLNQSDNFCGKCGKAVRSAKIDKFDTAPIERPTAPQPTISPEKFTPPPIRTKAADLKAEKKREELRAELKKLLEKNYKREVTDSELFEAENWLHGYAELMWKLGVKEMERQKKLEENPKGFHLEGEGYTCFICGGSVSNEQTWYDKYGIKCLTCQGAVDKKIIPASAASDKDSWYTTYDIERSFCINRFGLRRLVKEGLLKSRIIPNPSGRTHYQLFLIADNKDVLPPKKLVDNPMVKYKKDGEDWYHTEPWFNHADPIKVLKGYKILDYMKTLKEHEIQKTTHDLSFQIPKGARSMLQVNHINKDEPKNEPA